MRRSILVGAALVAVALGVVGEPSSSAAESSGARCAAGLVMIEGQGCSERLPDGLYRVALRDGSSVTVHGPDPAQAEGAESGASTTSSAGYVCVGRDVPHGELVYAVPRDVPDRYALRATTVRSLFYDAADQLLQEGRVFGRTVRYRMLCDSAGAPLVRHVVTATPSSQDDFSTIISDLRDLGWRDPKVQYWVWYDSRVQAGGEAQLCRDDSPSWDNCSNVGPRYAISYQAGGLTMMHENAHNMGAVQSSAPHSSKAGHCHDGDDLMCYDDRGPGAPYRACSTRLHFDCNNDDYFHPGRLPPSNYLADHWNLGGCFNLFVDNSFCGTGSPPIAAAPAEDQEFWSSVQLDSYQVPPGGAADAEGRLVSYEWRWVLCRPSSGGSACPELQNDRGRLRGGSSAVPGPSFYGATQGTYELELRVFDDTANVDTDRVTITAY